MSLWGGEDTWCVRLGTGSGMKTEENVFLQRDCIQSLKTVIWDLNSLHGLSPFDWNNVVQQRRLASIWPMSEALWQSVCPPPPRLTPKHPHPTPTTTTSSPGIYLLCHNAWLLRFCRRAGCAASSVCVRWMRGLTVGPWGPLGASTVTSPFTGILVPFHSQTKGKVFKLDLKNRKYIYIHVCLGRSTHARAHAHRSHMTIWLVQFVPWQGRASRWRNMTFINHNFQLE